MLNWEARLAAVGCRITVPRRAVMQVLLTAGEPLPVAEILARGQILHAELGTVTVYRALSLLTDLSLVRRVHMQDGSHAYLLASPGQHHALICEGCGRSVEFTCHTDLDVLIERIERQSGYAVRDHLLQLSGLCPDCQR